jgi:hypothetical protein
MIHVEELMIGNYLTFTNDYPEPITEHIIEVTLSDMQRIVLDRVSYDPIPIDEEWLIDFGFEKDGNWYDIDDSAFGVNIKEGRVAFKSDYNNYIWVSVKIPKYIHQLQNLYFVLTGKKLTICT